MHPIVSKFKLTVSAVEFRAIQIHHAVIRVTTHVARSSCPVTRSFHWWFVVVRNWTAFSRSGQTLQNKEKPIQSVTFSELLVLNYYLLFGSVLT